MFPRGLETNQTTDKYVPVRATFPTETHAFQINKRMNNIKVLVCISNNIFYKEGLIKIHGKEHNYT